MKKLIISSILVSSLLCLPITSAQFTDVAEDNKYYDAINYLENNGAIDSNTNFNPDEPITKAAFFKILLANSGVETDNVEKNYFKDLTGDEWYAPYANKAVEIGLIDLPSKDSVFEGNKYVTKVDAAKILLRWSGLGTPLFVKKDDWQYSYKDISYDNLYAPQIKMALDLNILQPYDDYYFGTYRKMTRGETALAIYNMDSYTLTGAYLQAIAEEIRDGMDIPLILILDDVYTRLTNELYNGDIDGETIMYEAIKSMVSAAGDPYTVFMDPSEAEGFFNSLSGDFKGIGVYLEQEDDGSIIITGVIEGAPAETAGFMAGDQILAVDDTDITGMTIDEVISLIQGEDGTQVKIRVKRQESSMQSTEKNITVTRGSFEIQYISTDMLENNILYYEILSFGENTGEEFEQLTEEALAGNNVEGIIIDLRNNGGGYVNTTIEILNHFISENDILFIISSNEHNTIYISEGPGELSAYPIVILINEYSASASEIMASCLQEYGYAEIMGTTSYGKGSAQDLYEYYEGSSLKITTSHWKTPNWTDINGIGVIPDIEVQNNEDTTADEQLNAAINKVKEMIMN